MLRHVDATDVSISIGEQHDRRHTCLRGRRRCIDYCWIRIRCFIIKCHAHDVTRSPHQACHRRGVGPKASARWQRNHVVHRDAHALREGNLGCRRGFGLVDLNLRIGPELRFAAIEERHHGQAARTRSDDVTSAQALAVQAAI
jgi:hypothetical protein